MRVVGCVNTVPGLSALSATRASSRLRPPAWLAARWTHVIVIAIAWLAASSSAAVPKAERAGAAAAPWSFQALNSVSTPAVQDGAWPRDDLDRFILSRLDAAGLRPNPDADRATWIRRVSFDLTGLPPTVQEVEAFVRDPAAADVAFATVANRYLASPRFGERWGRHWLDVVRYADSGGRSWNAPFTYAWRYRDYVIDAFNNDKPYDRFLTEQLAGDLLPAHSPAERREQIIATGLLALGATNIVEGDREQLALDRVDDQIDVTTRGMLALTVSCARCHDHKYDPIAQRDYYALAGVFYSTRTLSGQGARAERNLEYVDADSLIALQPSDGKPAARVPGVHSMSDFNAEWRNGQRTIRYTTDPNLAMGVTEGEVRDCELRIKGIASNRGGAPPRGDVHIGGLPAVPKVDGRASGRLEMARWITSKQNPLTARVMANRVWLHLFGHGLVATPDDFGFSGETPTHPELLDHLARRFMADGWSVKRLIRAVVLSRTYRLASTAQPAARAKDPQNELFWRMSLRRLEVEPLRDSLLTAAGRLSPDRPAGIQVAGIGGKARGAATYGLLGIDAPYRTVYLPVLRSLLPDLYGTFDFPDPSQITCHREVTTVGPQALFFMNSDFVIECSRQTADLLLAQRHRDDAERIAWAYRRLLGRSPAADETRDALDLLKGVGNSMGARDGWATLIQGLMASAEFRYVR